MLLKEFHDDIYPNTGFTHSRVTCRGIVLNDNNEIALIKIRGNDIFGDRDHYELPGGGVEPFEDRHQALQREILEELGYHVSIEAYLGLIVNRYNLLRVITAHHFFVAKINEKGHSSLTDLESQLFESIEWRKPEEWLEILSRPSDKINAMIHERESFIIQHYLNLK